MFLLTKPLRRDQTVRKAPLPYPARLASTSDGRSPATTPACPHCKGPTIRVARRQVDRLSTWLVPARRYRCQSFQCQWEGNVRLKSVGLAHAELQQRTDEHAPSSVSRVFLLSMALALAGITFILVSTYTDWLEPDRYAVSTALSPLDSPPPH